MVLSRSLRIQGHFVPINLLSTVGKSATLSKTYRVTEYGTLHQVSPRTSSMMKNCCSICLCFGSAQMVQQQLKLVVPLSSQL